MKTFTFTGDAAALEHWLDSMFFEVTGEMPSEPLVSMRGPGRATIRLSDPRMLDGLPLGHNVVHGDQLYLKGATLKVRGIASHHRGKVWVIDRESYEGASTLLLVVRGTQEQAMWMRDQISPNGPHSPLKSDITKVEFYDFR